MKLYYKFWSWISQLTGKNSKYTPTAVIKDQLNEKRALPLGVTEFHTWSDRIISGACIPGATPESIKFALADQLLHLGPTVDFEADLYFIKCLRKFAINQVADSMRHEIRDIAKARLAATQTKLEVVDSGLMSALGAQNSIKTDKRSGEEIQRAIDNYNPGEVTPPTNGVIDGKEILGNS